MEDIFDRSGLEHQHVPDDVLHSIEKDPPHFVAAELLKIAKELAGYVDSDAWRVMHHLMEGIMEDAEEANRLVGDTANSILHLELSDADAAKKAKYKLGFLDAKLEILEKETKSYRRVIHDIADSVDEEGGNPFGVRQSSGDDMDYDEEVE